MNADKLHNAAIILLGMGEKYAGDILRGMNTKEIEAIIAEIDKIENVTDVELIEALNDFFKDAGGTSGIDLVTKQHLKNSLATAAEFGMLNEGKADSESRNKWIEVIKWQPIENIIAVLQDEHPQVIAVIVATLLNGEMGSKIIKSYPPELQNNIILRISNMGSISTFALDALSLLFQNEFRNSEKYNAVSVDGIDAMANIMSYLDAETEKQILNTLNTSDESLSEKIQDKVLPFDKLAQLDSKSLQVLLKEINNDDLVVALKGADDFVKSTFMKNMSVKTADILKDELETKGPVRVTEVMNAQKRIIKLAKQLADSDKIILTTKSDSDVIY